jgi:hypothetical protein
VAGETPPTVYVIDDQAVGEDGSVGTVLVTQPQPAVASVITGRFSVGEKVIAGDHLIADVGFLQNSGDSVVFRFLVDGIEVGSVADTSADQTLQRLDVPLTDAVGKTSVTIEVEVAADAVAGSYEAVWKSLRMEGRTE